MITSENIIFKLHTGTNFNIPIDFDSKIPSEFIASMYLYVQTNTIYG